MSYAYPDMYGGNFDFYGQGIDGALGGMVGGAVGIFAVLAMLWLVIGFLSFAYSVTMYIFHSLGLYSIAQRRGIHRPWMAWVPVVNMWILGSISDQYQYVVKGKVSNRRKLLLGLEIAGYGLSIAASVAYFVLFIKMVSGGFYSEATGAGILGSLLVGLVLGGLAVVALVFRYIAYYDLFQSSNPGNATVYLVLSILFSFLLPIFVFCCRKKDLGMPPRKSQNAAPVYQQPVYQNAPQPVYAPAYQPETVAPEVTAQPDTAGLEVVEAQEEDFAE